MVYNTEVIVDHWVVVETGEIYFRCTRHGFPTPKAIQMSWPLLVGK
jgi:hypothetical protein